MKVIKVLGTGLLSIVLIWLLISVFLSSSVHISRSIDINSTQEIVFKQIHDLTTWQHWSYWDNIDPAMESVFEGPKSGVGAVHKWRSDNDSVGVGSLTIIETDEPTTIITSLFFEGMGTSEGGWLIEEAEFKNSHVTVYMDINVGFWGRVFPGLMMNGWLGPDFEKSLVGLKKHCESILPEYKPRYPFEILKLPESHVLVTKRSCSASEISSTLGESYGLLMIELQKQGLEMSGAPFAIYHEYSVDKVELEPGFPISSPGVNSGGIIAKTIAPMRVIRVDYHGAYENIPDVYTFIKEFTARKMFTVTGPPWESYVTDPGAEPDTSKWLTQIFHPIE